MKKLTDQEWLRNAVKLLSIQEYHSLYVDNDDMSFQDYINTFSTPMKSNPTYDECAIAIKKFKILLRMRE